MGDLLKKLVGSKWGVVGLLSGAAVTVGVGVAAHDSPEVQGVALAAVAVCGVGVAALIARVAGKIGGGGPPLAPPPAVSA